jgi:hypothetical protein
MPLHNFLIKNGYKGPIKDNFKDYCVYYHRSVPDARHQWVIYEHDLSPLRKDIPLSYTVEMTYECTDGTWVNSSFYSLTGEDLKNRLHHLEDRLYNSVESMGGDKNHYQGKREE